MLVGFSVAVIPAEDTEVVSMTVPLRPKLCTEIVEVPDEPEAIVRLEKFAVLLG